MTDSKIKHEQNGAAEQEKSDEDSTDLIATPVNAPDGRNA